jgi:hypothetical protein
MPLFRTLGAFLAPAAIAAAIFVVTLAGTFFVLSATVTVVGPSSRTIAVPSAFSTAEYRAAGTLTDG